MNLAEIVDKMYRLGELSDPDQCLSYAEIHPEYRSELNLDNPFPKQRDSKWQGCYLFCAELIKMNIRLQSGLEIDTNGQGGIIPAGLETSIDIKSNVALPLYAGQSSALAIRLWQHCVGRTGWFNEYVDMPWDSRTVIIDNIRWEASLFPVVFIWYIKDKKQRVMMEHEILSKVKPLFNKQ